MKISTRLCLNAVIMFFMSWSQGVSGSAIQAWNNLGLYGGQVYDIAIDPHNSTKMFAGTYAGDGLFTTSDGGANWHPVRAAESIPGEDTFRNHAVYAVKIAPTDSRFIWVAHNYWVEVSEDGGDTWFHVQNGSMQQRCKDCGGTEDDFRFCRALAVDPTDPKTAYVGTSGPDGYSGSPGAVYKTLDGGRTWRKMNQGQDFDYSITDLAVDPTNRQIVWAATNSYGVNGYWGTLYRSEDGGETWTWIMKLDSGFTSIAVKPNEPNVIYTGSGYGVMKTFYDGTNWQYQWPLIPDCRLAQDVVFDPQNPEVIYAAWRNTFFGDFRPKLSRSVDGGATWETFTIDVDLQTLAVYPQWEGVIYGGTLYRGVYGSGDKGETWIPVTKGLSAVITLDVAVDPNDSSHLLAGTVAGLFERDSGGEWHQLLSEEAAALAFHPVDRLTFYAGLWGRLARTTDGGLTWDYSTYLGNFFIRSIAVSPSGIIYLAAEARGDYGRIFKSSDGGRTFLQVLAGVGPLSGQGYDFNVIAIDPSDALHLFAGGGRFYAPKVLGDLWESTDGGEIWRRTRLRNVIVNDVLIDPRNPDIIYAGCGYSGGTDNPLFKSTDGGRTWAPSRNGIPSYPSSILSLWGLSKSSFYAVGLDGTILHYNGETWSPMPSGTLQALHAVWGASPSNIVAVGESGVIRRYDGASWRYVSSGTSETLYGVWGASGSDVFAVGTGGTILHYDGQAWSPMASGTSETLYGIWGASGSDVFAVGTGGTILHFDGHLWLSMTSTTSNTLESVWGVAPDFFMAVGYDGTILRYDGNGWASMESTTQSWLNDIWGLSRTDVYAVGSKGTLLHFNGTAWEDRSLGKSDALLSIRGTSISDLFSASDLGGIYHFDGKTWSAQKPPGQSWNSVTALELHPEDSTVIYAATLHAGVYVSPNMGGNWVNLGTADYDVHALASGSLYAASEGGLLQCTGTGVIAGQVKDGNTMAAIDDATVYNTYGEGAWASTSSVQGQYMLVVPAGITDVVANAPGYHETELQDLTVYGGDVSWADLEMYTLVLLSDLAAQPGKDVTYLIRRGDGTLNPNAVFVLDETGHGLSCVDLIAEAARQLLSDVTATAVCDGSEQILVSGATLGENVIPLRILTIVTTSEPQGVRVTPEGNLLLFHRGLAFTLKVG
jgi:photosystem II stability/assembly factor-like uncharacterized protein